MHGAHRQLHHVHRLILAAYKDVDAVDGVMAAQSDLVEVLHTLRQVVCVKG